jgi:hypothetical protein
MTWLDAAIGSPHPYGMDRSVKFSSKMREETLNELRRYAEESDRTLASVLGEAAEEYLRRARVRPAFRSAADRVLDDHTALLERLAR